MALFKTIDEIREFIPVNVSEEFQKIKPDIEWAQDKFIIPIIGIDLFNDLNDELQNETPVLTAAQERLLKKVRMPLIHFAYSMNFIISQVNIDGAGISIQTDGTRKTAFQWQIHDLTERYAAEKAFDGVEWLLAFLEENISDYPTWEDSEGFTLNRQSFINSAKEFNRIVNINNSRLTFSALTTVIKGVEELEILPVLGEEFYNDLKNKIKTDSLSAEEKILISKIQPVVACLSASQSIAEMPMKISGGSLILDTFKALGDNSKNSERASLELFAKFSDNQKSKGLTYLGRLKDFLQATATSTTFSIFFNSDLYINPEKREPGFYKNTDSPSFVM